MKKVTAILSFAVSLLYCTLISAQGFDWIQTAGYPVANLSASNIEGHGVGVDGAGNVYVAGIFHDTTTFDTEVLVTASLGDGFIAKYNSAGVIQWVRQISNANTIVIGGLAVDAAGNSYITGNFNDSTSFNGELVVSDKTDAGWSPTYDFFMMSLDASGANRWVQVSTGAATASYSDVAISSTGTVIAMMGASGATTWGGQSATKGFVLGKVNTADGTLAWATSDGTGLIPPTAMGAIAVDASGNVAVNGPAGFFGLTVGDSALAANCGFTALFNSSGVFQWVRTATSVSTMYDICFDGTGNIYCGGMGSTGSDFGSGETMAAAGGFLAKYGSDGTLAWLRTLTGGVSAVKSVVPAADGVYAAGGFQTVARFDSGDSLTTTIPTGASFLAAYAGDGTVTPIAASQSTQEVSVNAAAIDAAANVYMTGFFRIHIEWGDQAEDASSTIGAGALPEMWVTKYNSTGNAVRDCLATAADALGLRVYPNPVTDRLTVSLDNAAGTVIRLLDINGMEVPVAVENGTVMLPRDVKSGAYLLEVISGTTRAARKIFVK